MAVQTLDRKAAVKKWEEIDSTLSIKDIKDQYVKENVAIMLENEMTKDWNGNSLFLETSQAGVNTQTLGSLGYTDGSQNVESWKFRPVAIALVRRTFPDLFANKVVGVQAMSTPVGLAFALRFVYNDENGNEMAWDAVPQYGGYTGSSIGASAELDTQYNGVADTSATGYTVSAAEAWQLSSSGSFPQGKLRLDKVSVDALTRKLGASFSLEAAQDIKAMHDLDVEREMLNVIQYEVLAELDRELLTRMKYAAVDTAKGGSQITQINCSGTSALDGRWSQERYAGIVTSLIQQANYIGTRTRRGPGNFAVVSPTLATVVQTSGHPFTRLHSNVNATSVMAEIGTLNDQITVYRDLYATTDYALVGFKGPGISDCGIIFSPYIMGLTARAIDPTDFSPRVAVMSRYGLTDTLLGSGRYYRLISYSNLSQIVPSAA